MADRKDILRALRGLKDNVGDEGIEKLASALEKEGEDSDEKWQENVLKTLSDAVRKHGPDGVDSAYEEIEKMLAGEPADLGEYTSLRAKSELLAELQNAEAKKKERLQKFLQAAFRIIKQAVKAAL